MWRWRGMVIKELGEDIKKREIVRERENIWWKGNM